MNLRFGIDQMAIKRSNFVAAISAFIVLVFSVFYGIGYGFTVNDDRLLYIYGMYRNSFDAELQDRYEKLNAATRQRIEEIGYDETAIRRHQIQRTLDHNSVLASSIYYQARKYLFGSAPSEDSSFPVFLARVTLFCFLASIAVAASILTYTLVTHVSAALSASTATALLLMYVARAFPTGGLTQPEGLFEGPEIMLPLRIALFLIKPDLHMDYIGYLPKSQFLMLVLAVFAVRWSGRIGLGYVFIFIAGLFHQGMSWLLLALLLAVDVLLRPHRLIERGTLIGLALITGRAILDNSQISIIWQGVPSSLVLVVLSTLLVSGAAILTWWFRSRRAYRLRNQLLAYGQVPSDLIMLTVIWFGILAATYAVSVIVGRYEWFFWGVVAGRVLAILRLALFIGLTHLALTHLIFPYAQRHRWFFPISAALIAIVAVLQFVRVPGTSEALHRGEQATAAIEAGIDRRTAGRFKTQDEHLLYYVLIKSVETGQDYVPRVFR